MKVSDVVAQAQDYINAQQWTQGMYPQGPLTSGYVQIMSNKALDQSELLKHLMRLKPKENSVYSGTKPIVICGGTVTECKDLDEAQIVAEREAHRQTTDAYILKPIKRVAPKRETVTTELP